MHREYSRGQRRATESRLDLPDNSVCTLSHLLGHIVPFVDNELLVEDLEGMASLKVRHYVYLYTNGYMAGKMFVCRSTVMATSLQMRVVFSSPSLLVAHAGNDSLLQIDYCLAEI